MSELEHLEAELASLEEASAILRKKLADRYDHHTAGEYVCVEGQRTRLQRRIDDRRTRVYVTKQMYVALSDAMGHQKGCLSTWVRRRLLELAKDPQMPIIVKEIEPVEVEDYGPLGAFAISALIDEKLYEALKTEGQARGVRVGAMLRAALQYIIDNAEGK